MLEIAVSDGTSLSESCVRFRSRCHCMGLATGTLLWYDQILRSLVAFLEGREIHGISRVLPSHLRDYLSSLRERGQSSETVFRTWGALKCFFRFLNREGLLAANPMALVERPRRERRIIPPLNMAQARGLLSQPDTNKPHGLRDLAMILLMVDSGLRVEEALTLETKRSYLAEGLVTVAGKGGKDRSVPIGNTTRRALEDYLKVRGNPNEAIFFLGRGGRRLQRRHVEILVQRYGQRAGIWDVPVTPHNLRRTFAVQYIMNGGDPFSLQAILGHSTLDMVRIYVNLARHDVAEQHKKFSPMDRLLGSSSAAIPLPNQLGLDRI